MCLSVPVTCEALGRGGIAAVTRLRPIVGSDSGHQLMLGLLEGSVVSVLGVPKRAPETDDGRAAPPARNDYHCWIELTPARECPEQLHFWRPTAPLPASRPVEDDGAVTKSWQP